MEAGEGKGRDVCDLVKLKGEKGKCVGVEGGRDDLAKRGRRGEGEGLTGHVEA